MRHRTDGLQTRQRLLTAACAEFAEKGFRAATISGICRRAGVNIALVNYHFQGKEALYVEVWKHCARQARELYPVGGGIAPSAAPAERLRGHARSVLQCMTDTGRLGHFHRLHTMEMANPTGLMDGILREIRQPYREQLQALLRELLGPGASARQVELCEMSFIGQCLKARFGDGPGCSAASAPPSARQLTELVDHITRFTLGGIAAVRRANKAVAG